MTLPTAKSQRLEQLRAIARQRQLTQAEQIELENLISESCCLPELPPYSDKTTTIDENS
jgi:hypothetical protein